MGHRYFFLPLPRRSLYFAKAMLEFCFRRFSILLLLRVGFEEADLLAASISMPVRGVNVSTRFVLSG